MLKKESLRQIHDKGVGEEQINRQLGDFIRSFPYLKLEGTATPKKGLTILGKNTYEAACKTWQNYQTHEYKVIKFVPASGVASHIFKDLLVFLKGNNEAPASDFEEEFFSNIHHLALYEALSAKCQQLEGRTIDAPIAEGRYKAVVAALLNREGLNYGQLPKGLLLSHSYSDRAHTPVEEHLAEVARYTESNKQAHVHSTVSHEHLTFFKQKAADKQVKFEGKFGVGFNIPFFKQKPSTDTIAANPGNTASHSEDGLLLFRPAGHNALIENLNDLDTEIVSTKDIDDVVPDRLKEEIISWKMIIAGKLMTLQERAFAHLHKPEEGNCAHPELEEVFDFLQSDPFREEHDVTSLSDMAPVDYLHRRLNHPMRVYDMARNVDEPGGGLFLVYNQDDTANLQILEDSQIGKNNEASMRMFTEDTHFNSVDLACATRDHKGNASDLTKYANKSTGFISSKSENSRELKVLEPPSLWNGTMSDQNTVSVEIPLATFNPVKIANDLLRGQHQ